MSADCSSFFGLITIFPQKKEKRGVVEKIVWYCIETLLLSPGSEGLDKWLDHQDEINLLHIGDPILRFKLL